MTERRNIKYMRAFILSLISLYIIYATYFVDMQDDYFNNNKNECIDMQEIFDRLKNRSMFFSQRFLIQSFYLWVTENPNRQEKNPHILDIK